MDLERHVLIVFWAQNGPFETQNGPVEAFLDLERTVLMFFGSRADHAKPRTAQSKPFWVEKGTFSSFWGSERTALSAERPSLSLFEPREKGLERTVLIFFGFRTERSEPRTARSEPSWV